MKTILAGFFALLSLMPAMAAAPVDQILQEYYVMQRGLAADSIGGVAAAAQKIATISSHAAQTDRRAKAKLSTLSAAAAALRTADVKTARLGFGELSKRLAAYLQTSAPRKNPPYQFYCPMAKKSWLQPDRETRNPYYGSAMLKCGDLIQ